MRVLVRREFESFVYGGKAKPSNWVTVRLINFAFNWKSKRTRYHVNVTEKYAARLLRDRRGVGHITTGLEHAIVREEAARVMEGLTETEREVFRALVFSEPEVTLEARTGLKRAAYLARIRRAKERFE